MNHLCALKPSREHSIARIQRSIPTLKSCLLKRNGLQMKSISLYLPLIVEVKFKDYLPAMVDTGERQALSTVGHQEE